MCPTAKQTVIHMSARWPRFHLEQFHRGPRRKPRSCWGQGFKAVPCLATLAITALLVSPFICGWGYIHVRLHQCVFISRGEGIVTVKNSHRRPCHFTSTASRPTFLSRVATLAHLPMSVGYQRKKKKRNARSNLFGGIRQISAVHRDRSGGSRCR